MSRGMGLTKQQLKELRIAFRNAVFERDHHRCRRCGSALPPLDAHHIVDRHDMPNGGYVPENGIALCCTCHVKAEAEHRGEEPEPGYSRSELYALIGSDFDLAWKLSEQLGREQE